jgi:hypothetical protein
VAAGSYKQDVVVGVGMRISYSLRVTPRGTQITHTLASDLPEGKLGRVLSFFLARRLKKMQRELLANLARQADGSST